MNPKTNYHFITILVIVANIIGVLSGCTPSQINTPASPLLATVVPTPVNHPTATSISTLISTFVPAPIITLKKGDFYFSIDGQQSLIFSRNLAGYETSQYYQLLDLTRAGGSKLVRVQLDSLGMGYSNTGEVDDAWVKKWEDVFTKAASNGIDVLPVFGVWYDWNDGNGPSTWKSNPFNNINEGPAKTPAELFISDSPTQKLWLGWMKTLIGRWQGQKNIIAWEIFSEVNMAPGTNEPEAIDFVNNAALIIHNADSYHRPITASLADYGNWSGFYRSDSIDFINIHPYPVSGKLDSTIIAEVRSMLAKYRKPVLIGESGLSFQTPDTNPSTLTTAPRAEIGINHAIWAAMVSGAMNGRALWWEDGVAIYFPALDLPFIRKYANADLPVSNFVRGVDFADFQPLTSTSSSGVWGAAIGNEKMALGWYRDATSEPPDWNLQPVVSKQTVSLTVPGSASSWKVFFYNTKDGTTILSSASITRQGSTLTIPLLDFQDDIAFKVMAQAGTASTTAPAIVTTDSIAGIWSGTISNLAGTFSTSVKLTIQTGCKPGEVCGTFSAPQLPCSGDLFLQTINSATFLFLEQNASGAASCKSGGYEQLQMLAGGTLSYEYLAAPGSAATSTGILKHP